MRSRKVTTLSFTLLAMACGASDETGDQEASELARPRVRRYQDTALTCSEDPEFAPAKLSALSRLRVGPSTPDIEKPLLRPFFSDGCSASPDGVPLGEADAWQQCCVTHDAKYWLGGTEADKRAADDQLEQCIAATGHPSIAALYKAAVRTFGTTDSRMLYRWGYGWNKKIEYAPLSGEADAQAKALYGKIGTALVKMLSEADIELERICVANDPALNRLTDKDKVVYRLLQQKLDAADTVVWAKTRYFDLEKERFEVQLAGCKVPMVVVFSRADGSVLDFEATCK